MTAALRQVAELVALETGIVIGTAQYPYLQAAIARTIEGGSADELLAQATDPARRSGLVTRLVDEVTIKETSFLRDHVQLEAIDWHALHHNACTQGDGTIRVWSAACSTGEEPYTLALLACQAFASSAPGYPPSVGHERASSVMTLPRQMFGGPAPPVSILATDVSGDALRRAHAGRYGERAVRQLPPAIRDRYVPRAADGTWTAAPELRALVHFARHNLVHDAYPPLGEQPFDLVLCRNVLIYFDGDTVERVVTGLERATRGGGTLMFGAADALAPAARRLARTMHAPSQHAHRRPFSFRASRQQLRRPLGDTKAVTSEHPASPLEAAQAALAVDPADADAHFTIGLAELEGGDALAALRSFRRALHFRPSMAIAAFELGRAADATGDPRGARSAYEQALRTLDESDGRDTLLGHIDPADIAAACRARLALLR